MRIVWCLTHRNPLSHCIQKKQDKQIADLKARLAAAEKTLNRFPDYFAYEREYKKLESRIERLKKVSLAFCEKWKGDLYPIKKRHFEDFEQALKEQSHERLEESRG
jgi:hypothetical protein